MNTIFKLARRNIWRNRGRTLISASAILFAVLLAISMSSFQQGAWDSTINGVVNSYFGHVQIHKKGYWEEQIIDSAFAYQAVTKDLLQQEGVQAVLPRLEEFALFAHHEETKGKRIIGTNPALEDQLSSLKSLLVEGTYLQQDDDGILIADTMAREFNLKIGDTLAVLGQGYHGTQAVGKYPVRGFVKYNMPQMKQMIFMTIQQAQELFYADGLATTLIVIPDDYNDSESLTASLQKNIDPKFEVMHWKELIPDLLQAKELDTAGNKIVMGILYLIIGFAIFGTILMMVKERQYEFGVLTAIGMKRSQLGQMIWMETMIIGLVGAFLGMLIAFPIVYHFHTNPIDVAMMGEEATKVYADFGIPAVIPFTLNWKIFMDQAVNIMLMLTFFSIYPIWTILRLKPVEAMRE